MATSDWAIPTGKAITGATYIKDTDDNIAATIEDLVDWCNNANGTYTDWTLTGLRTDFLTKTSAQTLSSVTTVDTGGAIDFTNGELRIGGTAVTSTATELNVLDGISPTLTATELSVLDGISPTLTASELSILDGVTATATDLNKASSLTSGTYNPTISAVTNVTSANTYPNSIMYSRNGSVVTMSGMLYIQPTATGLATVSIPIPIASNFTVVQDATGTVTIDSATLSETGYIKADATTDTIYLNIITASTSGHDFRFTAQYVVK